MNVLEGLQTVRRRLEDNGANQGSLDVVDAIMKRAALPAARSADAQSLIQLVRMLMRTPAGRWGEPGDLSGVAVFLASRASDFITGASIPVDGGYSVQV